MPDLVAMGPFRIDLVHGRLLRDGIERDLRPQAFRALRVLIQSHGEMVDYGQLTREAWGIHVSKHTVATTINELKHVLQEYGSWITCRPKVGYRLEIPKSEEFIKRGWHFRSQYTRPGFENALCCFQQACAEDGTDFRAFEAIANIYLTLAGFLMRAPSEMRAAFAAAQDKVATLRGETATLRLDRAFGLFVFERRLRDAEAELLALEPELPDSVLLYVRLALIQLASGSPAAACSFMAKARVVDSLAPELSFLEVIVSLFTGEFAAAVVSGKRALDLHPGSSIARAFYAEALDFAGYDAEALAQYRLATSISPETTWIRADQARSLAVHGLTAEAEDILDGLEKRRTSEYVDAYHVALALDALGRREEAIKEMERAADERSYALLFSVIDAKAAGLRRDFRYKRLRTYMAGIRNGRE